MGSWIGRPEAFPYNSDESAYATGAEFVVDGGLTSYVPVKI
jgi:hypothetical protein